jgi:secreted Zn-dependent insulinase-like peptidase
MTLARIFQKMLSDDLNSYVYDATIAGSYYRVLCTPFGFSIALTGFSEKLLHLLEVVLSRIFSLLEDMKGHVSAELERKFDKAKQSLVIETRNLRLESPYELANCNTRMVSI